MRASISDRDLLTSTSVLVGIGEALRRWKVGFLTLPVLGYAGEDGVGVMRRGAVDAYSERRLALRLGGFS